MGGRLLPDPDRAARGKPTARSVASFHAADVATLSRLLRGRPNDRIDPFPPGIESEVLADNGARGKDETRHPRVVIAANEAVAYGAVDFSPHMRHGVLVGPLVHPAQRRKGYGRGLLEDLLGQASANRMRYVRATVGERNAAGQAMLVGAGFEPVERNTCMRLERPVHWTELRFDGTRVRRVWAEDSELVFELTRKLMPRTQKQTRSLLKTDTYAIIVAFGPRRPVGFAEVDLRHGDVACVELVEASPSLLQRGLGNVLLAEAVRVAFEKERVTQLELTVQGTARATVEAHENAGFLRVCEMITFERKL